MYRGYIKKIVCILLCFCLAFVYGFSIMDVKVKAETTSLVYKEGAINSLGIKYHWVNQSSRNVAEVLNEALFVAQQYCTHDFTVYESEILSQGNSLYWKVPVYIKCVKANDSKVFYVFPGLNTFSFSGMAPNSDIIVVIGDNEYKWVTTPSTSADSNRIFSEFLVELQRVYIKGFLAQSVCVMNSYVKNPSNLSTIMERDGETGPWLFKNNVTNLDFTVSELLHPLLGYVQNPNNFMTDIEGDTFLNTEIKDGKVYLKENEKSLTFKPKTIKDSSKRDTLYLELNAQWVGMFNDMEAFLGIYDKADDIFEKMGTSFNYTADNKEGFTRGADGSIASVDIKPQYCMSYMYPLAIPDYYTKSGSSSNIYKMKSFEDSPQYTYVSNLYINVKRSMVYVKNEAGALEKAGSFADFKMQREDIYLHNTIRKEMRRGNSEAEDSQIEDSSLRLGVAVYTKLYEAVIDTRGKTDDPDPNKLLETPVTSINQEGGIYLTGRYVKIGAKYGTNMPFDLTNVNTLQFEEPNTKTLSTTCAKFFAFGPYNDDVYNVDASTGKCHFKTTAMNFRFQTAFLNVEDSDSGEHIVGLCLIRNNYYANDANLLQWLSSDGAKGVGWVKADELSSLLSSSSTGTDRVMTYEDYTKMQAIKDKLAHWNDNAIYSWTRRSCVVVGFLIVFYGAILLLCFFFDLFNISNDMRLLGMVSFNKLRACPREDYEYLKSDTTYKYVDIPHILIRVAVCFLIGLLLVNFEVILQVIIGIFFSVEELTGIKV